MATRCRYGSLLLTAHLLAFTDPDYVQCDELAEYKAIIATDDDGFVVEVTTPVCPVHEAHVSQNPRFKRSIKLRSRPDATATSAAAGS